MQHSPSVIAKYKNLEGFSSHGMSVSNEHTDKLISHIRITIFPYWLPRQYFILKEQISALYLFPSKILPIHTTQLHKYFRLKDIETISWLYPKLQHLI